MKGIEVASNAGVIFLWGDQIYSSWATPCLTHTNLFPVSRLLATVETLELQLNHVKFLFYLVCPKPAFRALRITAVRSATWSLLNMLVM